jgi:hypothetical protein
MVKREKWSRWESNPRPLECHAVHGRPHRPRPYASIQEFEGSTPAPQMVADGRAPCDRPRTAPESDHLRPLDTTEPHHRLDVAHPLEHLAALVIGVTTATIGSVLVSVARAGVTGVVARFVSQTERDGLGLGHGETLAARKAVPTPPTSGRRKPRPGLGVKFEGRPAREKRAWNTDTSEEPRVALAGAASVTSSPHAGCHPSSVGRATDS